MKIYITDKNELREVALQEWDNTRNDGWSPNFFDDLEVNVPREYPVPAELLDDLDFAAAFADASAAMTDEEYREMVKWWQDEVDLYNAREKSWFTEDLSYEEQEAEFARDLEYYLYAD